MGRYGELDMADGRTKYWIQKSLVQFFAYSVPLSLGPFIAILHLISFVWVEYLQDGAAFHLWHAQLFQYLEEKSKGPSVSKSIIWPEKPGPPGTHDSWGHWVVLRRATWPDSSVGQWSLVWHPLWPSDFWPPIWWATGHLIRRDRLQRAHPPEKGKKIFQNNWILKWQTSERHLRERVTVRGEVTKSNTMLSPFVATSLVRIIKYSSNSKIRGTLSGVNSNFGLTWIVPMHDKVGSISFCQTESLFLGIRNDQLDPMFLPCRKKVLGQRQNPEPQTASTHDEYIAEPFGVRNGFHYRSGLIIQKQFSIKKKRLKLHEQSRREPKWHQLEE